jgi:hypothetical protein
MSSRTVILSLSLVLLLASLGFGGYTLQLQARTREALRRVQAEQAATQTKLQEERAAGDRRRREELAREEKRRLAASSGADRARSGQDSGSAARARLDRGVNFNAAIARHADVRAIALKAFRANLVVRFGEMYQTLGLTPAQINKFEDMATAHEDDRETLYAEAAQQGLDPSTGNVLVLHDQYMNQYYASLGIDLSPAVEAAVQQLDAERNRVGPLQSFVETADMTMDSDATPFTGQQRSQLVKMLATLSPSYQSGGNAEPTSIDWTAARTQAAMILSGPQLQAFDAQAQLMLLNSKLAAYNRQGSSK